MRGTVAKKLRRQAYGDASLKARRKYARTEAGNLVCTDHRRMFYKALKIARTAARGAEKSIESKESNGSNGSGKKQG